MKFGKYIKDKFPIIFISLISIITIILLLVAFDIQTYLIVLIGIILFIWLLLIVICDFIKRNTFYNQIIKNIENIDKKYLVLETIKSPNFYEGKIIYQMLYDINKSMIENVNEYEKNINDFKEYIEMWIHEVKIPISSLTLICHNNKSKVNLSQIEQIKKLDNYIDQVLYYVRSNYTENDFAFKEVRLDKIISTIALKNKDDLLGNNINLNVNLNDLSVYTDYKWLEFIINQIINNCIKYKKDIKDSYIDISANVSSSFTYLHIKDNGIGIPKRDLSKVFNKSFTGTNGRYRAKSTGMGLYIANKLCKKLGHIIDIESVEGEYTTVTIKFGNNKYYKF